MSYLVLARKYRPARFADMVGQETVTRTLRGAILENRVGHAYLFCGPRGTGKTTTARIFAKALNCEKGPAPDPCGTCERCRSADEQSEIDLIEIDAASNTGVDDVRGLRDQVAYAPMRARFKIYIVDEVHMLSKAAFNAFLKTLEEPPPHVKFLFATTDPEKLPDTVVSRCQVVKLAPIPERIIAERLEHVFEAEGIRAEAGVAAEIARRARGGMRDALSMADQLLSLVGSEPKLADTVRLAAGEGTEELERILDAVEAHDRPGVIQALPRTEGSEAELVGSLLELLRAALLAHLCPGNQVLDLEPAKRDRLGERARRLGVERLQIWLEELIACRERMRAIPGHARVVLEVTLLDLCRDESNWTLADLLQRLHALEQRVGAGPPRAEPRSDIVVPAARNDAAPQPRVASATRPVPAPALAPAPATSAATASTAPAPHAAAVSATKTAPNDASRAAPARALGTAETWKLFLETLGATALTETLRSRGRLGDVTSGRVVVQLSNLREPERALVHDPRNQKVAQAAFAKVLGGPATIVYEDQSAVRKERDPYTAKVAELFDGRIEDEG